MPNFEKHPFTQDPKHGLVGSFIDPSSIRNDSNVEISFGKLEPGFSASPHIHTQSKTVVIVLPGTQNLTIHTPSIVGGDKKEV